MILADKIIKLRRRAGYSQEELAEKMNVSRQSVSKWEAAQATPDLEKILKMSALFGVTTDYLLKDEMEDEEFSDYEGEEKKPKLTLVLANEYIAWRNVASLRIAIGVALCIISVIPLILMSQALPPVGLLIMLLAVGLAVAIFVHTGLKNKPYEFLESGEFELEYGVSGMVKEKQRASRNSYIKMIIAASVACVLSPIPLLCAAFGGEEWPVLAMLCVTLLIVAGGVVLFVISGVRNECFDRLLREGEHSRSARKRNKRIEAIESVYWALALAIYLGWSFISGEWHRTWIVWPIAGVLSAAVTAISKLALGDDREEEE